MTHCPLALLHYFSAFGWHLGTLSPHYMVTKPSSARLKMLCSSTPMNKGIQTSSSLLCTVEVVSLSAEERECILRQGIRCQTEFTPEKLLSEDKEHTFMTQVSSCMRQQGCRWSSTRAGEHPGTTSSSRGFPTALDHICMKVRCGLMRQHGMLFHSLQGDLHLVRSP